MVKKLLMLFVFITIHQYASAETIKLKTGKVIEGNIIKISEDEIVVDAGAPKPVTYKKKEIKTVDDKNVEDLSFLKEKQFYSTGELMSEGNPQEGEFRFYFQNGQVSLEGNFKDGQPWGR